MPKCLPSIPASRLVPACVSHVREHPKQNGAEGGGSPTERQRHEEEVAEETRPQWERPPDANVTVAVVSPIPLPGVDFELFGHSLRGVEFDAFWLSPGGDFD